jgi:hypothetical protein
MQKYMQKDYWILISRSKNLITLGVFVLGFCLAYEVGNKIAAGDLQTLAFLGVGFVGCAAALVVLRNWRAGFYCFLVWLLFEDLVRKYMGNNLALTFGKDVLALLTTFRCS